MKTTSALLTFALLSAPVFAGTWGAGSFDSDQSLDTSLDWAESGSIRSIGMPLEAACTADYLESPEAEDAVVAAEVVAASLGLPNAELPDELAAWIKRQPQNELQQLAESASAALACVRNAETSELYQLWAEQDATEWLRNMDDLAARLGRGIK